MPPTSKDREVTVVHLASHYSGLDDPTDLMAEMLRVADEADPPRLVLDLSATEYFDSQFVEVMVRVWKRIGARGGQMVLAGLSANCSDVIRVLKLDTIWDVYPTPAEAVAALAD
ncbi:MAG: anti-sigma factor antagonist [Planctomycetota bacterium]|nr:MAG: anti-sigma factor antagonist [Planctomycetota bacterium]REJ92708.1 MAG: anti-sigma factor antagonist [Planctomycetota bacterium]REK23746.1 MAG: anti-sigma factor antagonist [Planctomycetota bacterium]REK47599.1 MAG: anti-sigma factor antagonist [Planctomycetota bacterium]